MIRNKVLVSFFLEDGCSQKDGEVEISWNPINFQIYSNIFYDMVDEASNQWLDENTMQVNQVYEVIFAHTIETDACGAVMSEYFEPIYKESLFI